MSQISKAKQIKALKNGKGIQYLVSAASEILGNPILMHDVDYKLVAHTEGVVTDDPLWNELVTTGEHGSETLELFRNEGFMDSVANTKNITLLTSPEVKYDRIFGKVFNNDNIMVACIDVICYNKPFEDGDQEAFDAFRGILSKELGKSEYYQSYGKMYKETLIKKLIEGSIEDRTFYSCHIANLYHGLEDNLFLAVADISETSPDYAELTSFRDLFIKAQPDFKYGIYYNYIIIIISSEDTSLNIKKDLGKLQKIFEQNNIYAGISSCFDNLFELPKYYLEAVNALNYGLKNNSNHQIFQYESTIRYS